MTGETMTGYEIMEATMTKLGYTPEQKAETYRMLDEQRQQMTDLLNRSLDRVAEAAPPRATPPEPMTDERLALLHGYAKRETVVIADMLREALDEIDRLRSPSRESGALVARLIERNASMARQGGFMSSEEERALASLERDAARMREAAYRAGFMDGAGGTPKGHPSDFGDRGYEHLTAHAEAYAARYFKARAALAPSREPTTTPETSDA